MGNGVGNGGGGGGGGGPTNGGVNDHNNRLTLRSDPHDPHNDLRHSHVHGHATHLSGQVVGYDTSKTSASVSAFTPIQSGMLPLTAAATGQLGMGGGPVPTSRSYFPYDPMAFSKGPPQLGMSMTSMEMKSANTFNNQLISLHQIKNYAHHPNLGACGSVADHFGLGKDKGQ